VRESTIDRFIVPVPPEPGRDDGDSSSGAQKMLAQMIQPEADDRPAEWANLQDEQRRRQVGVWFREMEAAGVEPMERSGWAIGIAVPINLRLARMLVTSRVKQICRATTGDPHKSPPWLAMSFEWAEKGSVVSPGCSPMGPRIALRAYLAHLLWSCPCRSQQDQKIAERSRLDQSHQLVPLFRFKIALSGDRRSSIDGSERINVDVPQFSCPDERTLHCTYEIV
jgi:hypothetical protein